MDPSLWEILSSGRWLHDALPIIVIISLLEDGENIKRFISVLQWTYINSPPPIEPGGTYAHSASPEPPPPSHLGKRISKNIPPYLGYWLPLAITKNIPFSWFSREIFRDYGQKYPLSRENGNAHAAPICVRVGARDKKFFHAAVNAVDFTSTRDFTHFKRQLIVFTSPNLKLFIIRSEFKEVVPVHCKQASRHDWRSEEVQ